MGTPVVLVAPSVFTKRLELGKKRRGFRGRGHCHSGTRKHSLSGPVGNGSGGSRSCCRTDAKTLHSHRARRQGSRRTVPLRPHQRSNRLSRAINCTPATSKPFAWQRGWFTGRPSQLAFRIRFLRTGSLRSAVRDSCTTAQRAVDGRLQERSLADHFLFLRPISMRRRNRGGARRVPLGGICRESGHPAKRRRYLPGGFLISFVFISLLPLG